jgi:two-component system sensor histidine kinase PhoQ
MRSLHGRLLMAATLVLAGFLGAAGAALHNAFRNSAETALRERLLGYVYALIAAANEDSEGRMLLPKALPDQRFSNPDSGLYALVTSEGGNFRWRSPSLTGRAGDFLRPQPPGMREWRYWHSDDRELMVLNFGIAWEDYQGHETRYTLAVAADTAPLLNEIQGFRTTLWTWLGGLAFILLLAQGAILQWGLRPLRSVVEDLRRIESGAADRLKSHYPRELQGLTSNLNALIARSHANQQRYRNSLDDLAHSMKTPLAILRTAAHEDGDSGAFRALVQEQVQRMDTIVQHQLRRAAASGRGTLGRVVQVAPLVKRLTRSLGKVYRDKVVQVDLELSPEARFFGDEADLLEVLGNLADNAFKYGHHRVRVSAIALPSGYGPRPGLELCIEDDGPGIDPTRLDELMQRGRRLDEGVPGEGIGLSVAREIVNLYEGRIEAGRSSLGGAHIRVHWPPL